MLLAPAMSVKVVYEGAFSSLLDPQPAAATGTGMTSSPSAASESVASSAT